MADAGTLYVQIGAKMDDLTSALTQVASLLQQLSGKASDAGQQMADGLNKGVAPAGDLQKGLQGIVGQFAVGALAAQAFNSVMGAFKDAIADSIKNAIELESADAKLAATLEVTGRSIGDNLEYYKQFADAQQKSTTYSRAEVEASAALALQMTTLSKQGIAQVVEGAMGLAYVFGGDLQTRTRQVADGMEGVYGRLTMLIPQLKFATTEAEKHAIFIDVLNKSYRAAQEAIYTTAGQIQQAKNAWKEFSANAGAAALAVTHFRDILKSLTDIMEWTRNISGSNAAQEKLNQSIAEGMAKAQNFSGTLKILTPTMKEMGDVIAKGDKSWEDYKNHLSDMDAWLIKMKPHVEALSAATERFFGESPKPVFDQAEAFKELGISTGEKLQTELQQAKDLLASYLLNANPLPKTIEAIRDKITALTEALKLHAQAFEILETDIPQYGKLISQGLWQETQGLNVVTTELGKLGPLQSKFLWDTINLQNQTTRVWKTIGDTVSRAARSMGSEWANLSEELITGEIKVQQFFEGIWKSILKFFIQIVDQMIAKWLIFEALTAMANFFSGGVSDFFSGLAGKIGNPFGGTGGGFANVETIMGQQGWQGIVSQPTLFLAGEAGPEGVSITPGGFGGGGGGGNMTINLNVTAMDGASVLRVFRTQLMPLIQDGLNRRLFTVPRNALGGI